MEDIKVVTHFPRRVREIENTWIPLKDGVRLAARIWLPEDAEHDPVPAILEYLPYRKRDGTVGRDALTHPYFAGHGYASVRVDMRGTGDSEGICAGEYLLQEQEDALEILDWIAENPTATSKRDIARAFGIKGTDRVELKRVLRELAEDEEYEEKHAKSEHTLKFVDILYPRCEASPRFTGLDEI